MEYDEYRVIVTAPAKMDLIEIDDYISIELNAPIAAKKFADAAEEILGKLSFLPQGHPKVRNDRLAAKGYRWIGVKNYVAFYLINEKTKVVTVERILYGRRNWMHIL